MDGEGSVAAWRMRVKKFAHGEGPLREGSGGWCEVWNDVLVLINCVRF